jgi:hypothetical protein
MLAPPRSHPVTNSLPTRDQIVNSSCRTVVPPARSGASSLPSPSATMRVVIPLRGLSDAKPLGRGLPIDA